MNGATNSRVLASLPFTVIPGPVPPFAITSESPTSGPRGTSVTVQMASCPGDDASVSITLFGSAYTGFPLVSDVAEHNPDDTWSASFDVPGFVDPGPYFVQGECTHDGTVATVFAPFAVTGPSPPTTTTVPTTPLTSVTPTSGPAGTTVTVTGSQCSSVAGAIYVFLAANADPSTRLAETSVGADFGAPGDWSATLQIPDAITPGSGYFIGAQCWGDGFLQHKPGEQVEYFAYVPQSFTVTESPGTSATTATTSTTVPITVTDPGHIVHRSGYWMLGADGHVYAFGGAHQYGNAHSASVAIANLRDGSGYWVTDAAGNVSSFGTARGRGGHPTLRAGEHVSAISATPTGHGYYMVGSDGGVFSFGDARFHGSTGGTHLNRPVVGISPTPDNLGYWLVASDGGVFAFDAPFRGSMGAVHLNRPVNGLASYGNGYVMAASDGGLFDFSDKPFVGSLAENPPSAPIIGLASFAS